MRAVVAWLFLPALFSPLGCKREAAPAREAPPVGSASVAATATAATATAATAATAGPPKYYALEMGAPPCRAGDACTATIKLVATDGYHVNKEYPYKFVAKRGERVTFLDREAAGTFSRSGGDFVENDETTGTLTLRFRPNAPGPTEIAGTYRLSVCSGDQCRVDQRDVTISIPVM
jgi:hypothetical protein